MAEDKFALKPMYLYAIIGVFVVAFASTAIFNNDIITGFATGEVSSPPLSGTFEIPELPAEPACIDRCGEPCWLFSNGQDPGTFDSSEGRIGILGCDSKCYDVSERIEQLLCCSHSDCPLESPVCNTEGRCAE